MEQLKSTTLAETCPVTDSIEHPACDIKTYADQHFKLEASCIGADGTELDTTRCPKGTPVYFQSTTSNLKMPIQNCQIDSVDSANMPVFNAATPGCPTKTNFDCSDCGSGVWVLSGDAVSDQIIIPATAASWVPKGGCPVTRDDINFVTLRHNTVGVIPENDRRYCSGDLKVPKSTDWSMCTATNPCWRCQAGKTRACHGRDNLDRSGACNNLGHSGHFGFYSGSIGANHGVKAKLEIARCMAWFYRSEN